MTDEQSMFTKEDLPSQERALIEARDWKDVFASRGDSMPLQSIPHQPDPSFTTRIQIGQRRFVRLERIIEWIRFFIFRPKLSKDNLTTWRCGKCEGMKVPKHSRHCKLRI